MKNKAFTLVELLAVITLIGLIALVTVVAVTKSLGKSKSAIAKAQEEQLENAARLWMADHQMLKPNISNSDVVCNYAEISSCPKDYKTLVITLDTLQSEGYLDKGVKNLNNGNKLSGATEIEITLNGKKIEYKINKVEIPKFNGTYVKATSTDTHKGIIYMDPKDITKKCTAAMAEANVDNETNLPTNVKEGCLKFYIYDNSGSTYKMLLDHNTTSISEGVNCTDYLSAEGTLTDWNNNIRNNKGIITASNQLREDTEDWIGNPRFIRADEVAHIVGIDQATGWTASAAGKDDGFYLDGAGSELSGWQTGTSDTSKYYWLFDYTTGCISHGCKKEDNTFYSRSFSWGGYSRSSYGYYTQDNVANDSLRVRVVDYWGRLNYNTASNNAQGIRPVIELDKDIISGDDTPAKTYTKYNSGQEVLFDPVANAKCTTPVSTTGTKTGCMKWYVIKESGTNNSTVDVILDHNTTAKVAYETSGTYKEYEQASIKNQVDTDATGWASGLNPRLITADEIANITENTGWSSATASYEQYFYFGSNSTTDYSSQTAEQKAKQESYHWLFDYTNGCTSYGCDTADSSIYGYWTSSPVSDLSYSAWIVRKNGSLDYLSVDEVTTFVNYYGIRPVITISKSKLK